MCDWVADTERVWKWLIILKTIRLYDEDLKNQYLFYLVMKLFVELFIELYSHLHSVHRNQAFTIFR